MRRILLSLLIISIILSIASKSHAKIHFGVIPIIEEEIDEIIEKIKTKVPQVTLKAWSDGMSFTFPEGVFEFGEYYGGYDMKYNSHSQLIFYRLWNWEGGYVYNIIYDGFGRRIGGNAFLPTTNPYISYNIHIFDISFDDHGEYKSFKTTINGYLFTYP
ncbi:MAG: hypothetical protein AB1567_13065 [bacterium]